MAESATRTESVRMYVISPTGPSAPTSMPSYSCCAIRIVTRGKAQLLRGFLLQRAGAERRGRRAPPLALLDRADLEGELERIHHDRPRGRLVFDLRLFPLELVQPRLERLAVLLEIGLDGPVLLRHELADLLLALADQPQRYGLHPTRRQAGLDALPEERGRLVADQPVEHAARLLGVDFPLVDVEGMRQRMGDSVLGDLVEQDALHLAAVRELARHVPGDGLALAVRVGGEEHSLRGFRGLLDFGEGLGLLLDGHVLGREAVLDVHAELALRQIAQVPHRRLDGVARAQVLADRLGFGGRLDDDECALPAPALRGRRLGLPRASLGSHGHGGGGLRTSVIPGLATGVGLFPFHRFFLSSHASILRQTTRVRIFTIPHSIAQASRPRSPLPVPTYDRCPRARARCGRTARAPSAARASAPPGLHLITTDGFPQSPRAASRSRAACTGRSRARAISRSRSRPVAPPSRRPERSPRARPRAPSPFLCAPSRGTPLRPSPRRSA